MLGKVMSAAVVGLDALPVEVEAQVDGGLAAFDLVGLAETAVRESRVRVKAAVRNCGLQFPNGRIVVNLAPADLKKCGTAYDLPVAVALLSASGAIGPDVSRKFLFVGELSLLGRLRPVAGVLPMALCAKARGLEGIIVPPENAAEAVAAGGVAAYAPVTLADLVDFLTGRAPLDPAKPDAPPPRACAACEADLRDVGGQLQARRCLEIAAAGGHNVLMWGEPGAGKTMLARRMATLLPDMGSEERIEVTKIYSVAGLLPPGAGLLSRRPFRAPHHTASEAAIVGGGPCARPGEVSLANHGVLFLDELPEFRRPVLEALRQPMEDRHVTVSRARARFLYPARFQLVAAMNPCPCGYLGSRLRPCRCGDMEIKRYRSRVSGPLLDRIDLVVHVPAVSYQDLRGPGGEASHAVRERVVAARTAQVARFGSEGSVNARMGPAELRTLCRLDTACERLLERCAERMALSGRALHRVVKVARTIADLAGADAIRPEHLAEALSYRGHDVLSPSTVDGGGVKQ